VDLFSVLALGMLAFVSSLDGSIESQKGHNATTVVKSNLRKFQKDLNVGGEREVRDS
jgi:hypothetical protein